MPLPIIPSVDNGQWYKKKLESATSSSNLIFNSAAGANDNSWLPLVQSKIFVPKSFNYGNIYYHIIESVQSIEQFIAADSSSDDEGAVDAHTAKPLRRGQLFFKSGHIQNINVKQDAQINSTCFKADCMASFKVNVMYKVEVDLSTVSGQVKRASCTCKASGMGRCSHVAALLYALLDYAAFNEESPTSQLCAWNVGRKKNRNPGKVNAEYRGTHRKKIHLELGTVTNNICI
jgi:SWIM zinc finger